MKNCVVLNFALKVSIALMLSPLAFANSGEGIIVVDEQGGERLVLESDDLNQWEFIVAPYSGVYQVTRTFDPDLSSTRDKAPSRFKLPKLYLYCSHPFPIRVTILYDDVSAKEFEQGLMQYEILMGEKQETGNGQLVKNGVAFKLLDHGADIVKALINNNDIKVGVKDKLGIVEWFGFSSEGFGEVFNQSCHTHPNYENLTGLPKSETHNMLCTPIVRDERCQLPPADYARSKTLFLLEHAVKHEDIAAVNRLLNERPAGVSESEYFGSQLGNALTSSLISKNPEIARRLMDAGASTEMAIAYAIDNEDVAAIKILAKAGVNPSYFLKSFLMERLVIDNKIDMIKALMAVDVDFQEPLFFNWSLLMLAIHLERRELALELVSVSNPFLYSEPVLKNSQLSPQLALDYVPATNALAMAKISDWKGVQQVIDAIEQRASDLNDPAGLALMYIQTDLALGQYEQHRGNWQKALNHLEGGLIRADIESITSDTQGVHIIAAMNLLFHKHETELILGQAISDEDVQFQAKLTGLGGWFQPLHDMLKVTESAALNNTEFTVTDWEKLHGRPFNLKWNSRYIKAWIENETDKDRKIRLETVLGYFNS